MGETRAGPTRQIAPAHLPSGPTERGADPEARADRLTLEEEDDLTIVNVSGRVRAAFDVEKVTKKFYERFKKEQRAFLGFIEGIENMADREWYASLMLNRMMFIYFIPLFKIHH